MLINADKHHIKQTNLGPILGKGTDQPRRTWYEESSPTYSEGIGRVFRHLDWVPSRTSPGPPVVLGVGSDERGRDEVELLAVAPAEILELLLSLEERLTFSLPSR